MEWGAKDRAKHSSNRREAVDLCLCLSVSDSLLFHFRFLSLSLLSPFLSLRQAFFDLIYFLFSFCFLLWICYEHNNNNELFFFHLHVYFLLGFLSRGSSLGFLDLRVLLFFFFFFFLLLLWHSFFIGSIVNSLWYSDLGFS